MGVAFNKNLDGGYTVSRLPPPPPTPHPPAPPLSSCMQVTDVNYKKINLFSIQWKAVLIWGSNRSADLKRIRFRFWFYRRNRFLHRSNRADAAVEASSASETTSTVRSEKNFTLLFILEYKYKYKYLILFESNSWNKKIRIFQSK